MQSKTFNVQKFTANLKSQIDNSFPTSKPEGYSFMINQQGKIADSFSFGNARRSGTGAKVPWNTNQEINIASVTKSFTAVAVFQLLKKNNLKVTDSIGSWLPKYFNATVAIRNTTFEQLMTHSSGILSSNTSYDTILSVVRKPLQAPSRPANRYSNVNFALFRIIIPFLENKTAALSTEGFMLPGNQSGFEKWLSARYIDYMQNNVYTPAGLGIVNCIPSANTAQAFSDPLGNGQAIETPTPWTETCGGGGFYMSVKEMAQVMAYLGHTNTLLDFDQKKLMDAKLMGWDVSDSRMTVAGRAYGKNGALRWDSNGNNVSPDLGDAGLQTLVMKFPNAVELSLAINSIPGVYRSLSTLATTAYNAAWE